MKTSYDSHNVRRSRRIAGAALAFVLGASLVVTACEINDDPSTAATILPPETQGLLTAALDPSTSQKVNLLALSRRLPAKVQANDADDVKVKLIDQTLEGTGLTYDADVKPWIGGEAALAMLPPADGGSEPLVVGLLKVKDKTKATATFDKKKVDPATYRYIKDYVAIIDKPDLDDHQGAKGLDSIEAASKSDSTLEKTKRYKDAIDGIGGEHLVLGWIDLPALANTALPNETQSTNKSSSSNSAAYGDDLESEVTSDVDQYAGLLGDNSAELKKQADKVGYVSFKLYVASDAVVVEASTEKTDTKAPTSDSKLVRQLPSDTSIAVDVPDISKLLTNALNAPSVSGAIGGSDPQGPGPELKQLVAAIQGPGVFSSGDLTASTIPVGFTASLKDPASATDALSSLAGKLSGAGLDANAVTVAGGKGYTYNLSAADSSGSATANKYLNITAVVSGDRLILADTVPYAEKLAGATSEGIGSSDPWKQAFGENKTVELNGQAFLNLQSLIAAVQKQSSDKPSAEDQEWLDSLNVLGTQAWLDGNSTHVEMRLGFK